MIKFFDKTFVFFPVSISKSKSRSCTISWFEFRSLDRRFIIGRINCVQEHCDAWCTNFALRRMRGFRFNFRPSWNRIRSSNNLYKFQIYYAYWLDSSLWWEVWWPLHAPILKMKFAQTKINTNFVWIENLNSI